MDIRVLKIIILVRVKYGCWLSFDIMNEFILWFNEWQNNTMSLNYYLEILISLESIISKNKGNKSMLSLIIGSLVS